MTSRRPRGHGPNPTGQGKCAQDRPWATEVTALRLTPNSRAMALFISPPQMRWMAMRAVASVRRPTGLECLHRGAGAGAGDAGAKWIIVGADMSDIATR